MKLLLFALLLVHFSAFAQRPNFFSGSFQSEEHSIKGIRYVSGTKLSDKVLVGTMVGLTKIEGMKSIMMPFGAHLTVAPLTQTVYPVLVVEPGYNLYSVKSESMGRSIRTRGGFMFYGGGGVGIKMSDKASLNFIAGYSSYRFRTDQTRSNLEGIGFRVTAIGL